MNCGILGVLSIEMMQYTSAKRDPNHKTTQTNRVYIHLGSPNKKLKRQGRQGSTEDLTHLLILPLVFVMLRLWTSPDGWVDGSSGQVK